MYQPAHFAEARPEMLRGLINAHPLATLVTSGAQGLNANHLPFEFDPQSTGATPHGRLLAHVARNNPVWQEVEPDSEVLVIFQGAHAYVSPGWYPAKQEHGKVVPTWNYMVVHAYGRMRAIEDPAWLRALVGRLSDRFEAGRSAPWSVDDAPAEYIDKLLAAIVGIEIEVTRMVGKWKVSQNQPVANRAGVERGLREQGGEQALAMAEAVRSWRKE